MKQSSFIVIIVVEIEPGINQKLTAIFVFSPVCDSKTFSNPNSKTCPKSYSLTTVTFFLAIRWIMMDNDRISWMFCVSHTKKNCDDQFNCFFSLLINMNRTHKRESWEHWMNEWNKWNRPKTQACTHTHSIRRQKR